MYSTEVETQAHSMGPFSSFFRGGKLKIDLVKIFFLIISIAICLSCFLKVGAISPQ